MKSVHITTSIPIDIWNLATEKHLKWNECLILGIKTMLKEVPNKAAYGEEWLESDNSRIERIQRTMQSTIDELDRELNKVRERKG